ncbi:hypothetical protein A7982_13641 [Minicystis rosea]|nr:hypothetical protein A7982_13641 [Minicystis rosea]
MKIGIIGAGNIGSVLAAKLVALGHTVAISNSRGPSSLREVAVRTGARAATVDDAVHDAELVVVAIPEKSVPHLPRGLLQNIPPDAVVVDTGNYYPSLRDGVIDAIERGATESEWVAAQLGRPVVKAFNNIFARSLAERGRPRGDAARVALPIAGDDARARQVVLALVDALGFDGVDAGPLAESWRQQPGTPVYCTDLDAAGVRRALSAADRAKTPALRDARIAQLLALPPDKQPDGLAVFARRLSGVGE